MGGTAADSLMDVTLEKMQTLTGVEPDQEKIMEFEQKAKMKMAMMAKKQKELSEAIAAYDETTATPEETADYEKAKFMMGDLENEMKWMPNVLRVQGYIMKKEVVFGTMALEY